MITPFNSIQIKCITNHIKLRNFYSNPTKSYFNLNLGPVPAQRNTGKTAPREYYWCCSMWALPADLCIAVRILVWTCQQQNPTCRFKTFKLCKLSNSEGVRSSCSQRGEVAADPLLFIAIRTSCVQMFGPWLVSCLVRRGRSRPAPVYSNSGLLCTAIQTLIGFLFSGARSRQARSCVQ